MCDDLGTETVSQDLPDAKANTARAYETDSLPFDVYADEPFKQEVAFTDPGVGFVAASRHRLRFVEDEQDSLLAHKSE